MLLGRSSERQAEPKLQSQLFGAVCLLNTRRGRVLPHKGVSEDVRNLSNGPTPTNPYPQELDSDLSIIERHPSGTQQPGKEHVRSDDVEHLRDCPIREVTLHFRIRGILHLNQKHRFFGES